MNPPHYNRWTQPLPRLSTRQLRQVPKRPPTVAGEDRETPDPADTTTSTTFDTTTTTSTETSPTVAGEDRETPDPADPADTTTTTTTVPSDIANGSSGTDAPSSDDQSDTDNSVVLTPNPSPTEDLWDGPSYDPPLEAIHDFDISIVVIAMPATAQDVVGWSWESWYPEDDYDGGVRLVFDGWTVEHLQTGDNITARVTAFFTMTGDYTAKDPQSKSLTLLSDWHRGKPEQTVTAEYWEFIDRSTPSEGPGVPVTVEWLDPAIWAPVKPGEHRQLWMRWTVPINTDRLQVTIEDTTYMMFPKTPGLGETSPPATPNEPEYPRLLNTCCRSVGTPSCAKGSGLTSTVFGCCSTANPPPADGIFCCSWNPSPTCPICRSPI